MFVFRDCDARPYLKIFQNIQKKQKNEKKIERNSASVVIYYVSSLRMVMKERASPPRKRELLSFIR